MRSYNGFTPAQREKGARILRKAVKDGILPSPSSQRCVLCGQDKGIRHYHNEDYSEDKILDNARVLCWRCHMMLHNRFEHPLSFGKYIIDVAVYGKRFSPVYRGDAWEELEQHYVD